MDRDDLAEDMKPTKDNIVCLLFFFFSFTVLMRGGMVDDKDGRTSGGCTFWGSVFLPLYVFFERTCTCSLAGSDAKYRTVAGHSTQQDTDNLLEEEDGKDECTSSFVVPFHRLTDAYV